MTAAAALALCILALVEVRPAEAAYPGKNGLIAFVSNRDTGGGEIYAMKPDGTGVTRITFPTGGSGDPAFSPDGTKIAFKGSNNDIYVMNANGMKSDGTGAQRLTNTPVVESEPTWSPDGTKIAFIASAFEVDGSTDFEVWVMNADGTGRTLLTNNSFSDIQPAWSPDGSKIAFVSERRPAPFNDTDRNIYVMNTDGSGQTNVTPNTTDNPPYQGHDDDPTWSPDGSKIAYVHTYAPNASGVPNIWTMDPTGANKTNVSNNPDTSAIMPAWSPDGTRIAYVGVASGTTNRDIWTMNSDGTGQEVLHANAKNDIEPDWQQDSIPPESTITSGPPSFTNSTSASFSFASSDLGSSFECSLDSAAFESCASPKSYTGLTSGSHTLQVRATDVAGNLDATPASRTWTVDTTPPDTSMTSGPPSLTRSSSASFGFSSEPGARFQCSLDGAAFTSCASPKSYTGLTSKTHNFRVRAIDAPGNVDATPAVRSWKVDAIKPTVSGMSPKHASIIRDTTPTIKVTVKDNVTNLAKGNIKLYVAGKAIPASKYSYNRATDQLVYNSPRLSKGKKMVRIVATDAAKNVGARSWYFTIR